MCEGGGLDIEPVQTEVRQPAAPEVRGNSNGVVQTVAIAGYVVGGLAFATGITLVIINRPESYRIDPFAEESTRAGSVSVAPLVGSDLAGLSARMRF